MVENEIQFLSWSEFRQMAPSILQLEITRLGTLIDAAPGATDFRNLLVKARFELKRFVACLRDTDKEDVVTACAAPLHAALLNIALAGADRDEATAATLHYVADRIRYIHDRLPLIY